MSSKIDSFSRNVFVNCPFDVEYWPLLQVLLFTIIDCGLEPRIASESEDSGEVRVEKIKRIIKESQFSIHDISRIELSASGLPRFNMPFELGLDLGCRVFATGRLSTKQCLVLEKERYRHQKSLSDVAGNDPKAHGNDPETLVRQVRDWIVATTHRPMSSGTQIWGRYNDFYSHFYETAKKKGFTDKDIDSIAVPEFIDSIKNWVIANPVA